jgi:hypothetical protein
MRAIVGLLLFVSFGANAQTFTASVTSGSFPIATTLNWNVPGAATCTAGGAGSVPAWSGSVPTSGTRNLTGIGIDMTLTLSCLGLAGKGQAILNWVPPTTNTDGTPVSLAGYKILYGASAASLTYTVLVNVPAATAFTVADLAPATYAFAVRAVAPSGIESANSNVVTKTVMGAPGVVLPVLSVLIDGFSAPSPPSGLTVTDPNQAAYEIKLNSSGTLTARHVGYIPLGSTCDAAKTKRVGSVIYTLIPMAKPSYVGQIDLFVSANKLAEAYARCS